VATLAQSAAQISAKRAREILVTQALAAESLNKKIAAEIVINIQSTAGGRGEILGARKLPSGAIALIFKSAEAKN